jgi:hypothetical protein
MVERILGALGYLSGGATALLPLRQYLDRQIDQLQEILLEEMRRAEINPSDVIDDDHLIAFVLRLGRATLENSATSNLRLMARYFFQNATLPDYSPEAAADFFNITAQLTDSDMRCLALLKRMRNEQGFEGSR